jgi:hypothetical protein
MKHAIIFLFLAGVLIIPKIALSETSSAQSKPGGTSSSAVSPKTLIGTLKNPDSVEGCGCYFQTPAEEKKKDSRRFIFESDLDLTSASMNIDGRDLKLKIVGKPSRLPDKVKKGFHFTRQYSAGSIQVKVDFVVSWLCPPKDESCEVTNYDVTLTVEKGERKQTIQLKGGCGC